MVCILPTRSTQLGHAYRLDLVARQTEALMTKLIIESPDCLTKLSPKATFREGKRNPGSRKELCNLMTACLSEIIRTMEDWQIKVFRVADLHLNFFEIPWNSPNFHFHHTAALVSPPALDRSDLVDLTACQFYSDSGFIEQGMNNSHVPWKGSQAIFPIGFIEAGWVELNPSSLANYLFQTRDNSLMMSKVKRGEKPPYDIESLLRKISDTELDAVFENVNRPDFFRKFFENPMPYSGLTLGTWLEKEAKKVVETIN